MRIELSVIEKIEQYLMGTLNPNEKADFESQMNQDAELKSQVDLQGQLMEGIQRLGLKHSAQKAYKSYKLKTFLTKALVVGALVAAATYGVLKLTEQEEKTPAPVEYNETQTQITFPENDSLAADANIHLDQEIFRINTHRDTIVETQDGIVIYIPANAFNTLESSVDFLVQAALKPEDILNAGLSTLTADGQELETGGMFYIDAFVNGNRVELKKALTIDVPSGQPKSGMKLYDGEKNANGEIVWSNPKPLESFLNPVEITTLNFYPPDYEATLDQMGYSDKAFMDSLYYSFACEESKEKNVAIPLGDQTTVVLDERGRSQLKDQIKQLKSSNSPDHPAPKKIDDVLSWEFNPSHLGAELYSLVITCTAIDDYDIGTSSKSNNGIPTEIYFFDNGKFSVQSGPITCRSESYYKINGSEERAVTTTFTYYIQAKKPCKIDGCLIYMACSGQTCFPPEEKSFYFNLTEAKTENNSCQGINPASIQTIWNSKFNNTNLATKEFEERMPWIHKSCNNAVLELYVNNLDKKLSTVDSMAFKYLSGEVLEKFKAFSARNDGRVELDNIASQKMADYYEKQRQAITLALVETQQNYWKQQTEADAKNNQAQAESNNRNLENSADVFEKEYRKNLCNVFDELGLKKDCNSPMPANSVTVQATNLGWKNIDRLVLESTINRETSNFSANGKTTTLTYTEWSANLIDFEKHDRVNVYVIPREFNSYLKLDGTNGNYTYKLNADLSYQTVVLAWTADGIYFYKADAIAGHSNITLRKVSDDEWRRDIRNSLRSITNMQDELNYVQFMQKDQKRINTNKEKIQLRQKMEPIVFPCGNNPTFTIDSIISVSRTEQVTPAQNNAVQAIGASGIDPSFPGGAMALNLFMISNVYYPQEAIDKMISGTVYVGFTVQTDGTLSNIRVEKSVHPLLDEEAIRVVKLMPKWIPAQLNGQPVACPFKIPVNFIIS